MIGEIALAIEMGADAVDIGKTIHPHPTLGETIGMAAEVVEGVCTDLPPLGADTREGPAARRHGRRGAGAVRPFSRTRCTSPRPPTSLPGIQRTRSGRRRRTCPRNSAQFEHIWPAA